jgi:hypothetical protein
MMELGKTWFVMKVAGTSLLFGWSFDFAQDDEVGKDAVVVNVAGTSLLFGWSFDFFFDVAALAQNDVLLPADAPPMKGSG